MINFKDHPTAVLVAAHNACVVMLGGTPVARFSDRATAEKRTALALSQVAPAKRPEPFREATVQAEIAAVHSEKAPRSPPGARRDAAIRANVAAAAPKTPAPAAKGERWRAVKEVKPSRVAYRPRPGSKQAKMYDLLTREGGVTPEEFLSTCGEAKQTLPTIWGSVNFLFVTQKGYGLSFDGTRLKLLVPKDERDAPAKSKKGA